MIKAFWYISNNFGDNLNHYLIKSISGQPCIYTEQDVPHYIVCGSILARANEYSTVWGAGFGDRWQHEAFNERAHVLMVRGYKSAELIGHEGIVADPALLMPLLYSPIVEKKYKQSIIPHYVDYEMCLLNYSGKYHIIDPFLPVHEFINEVLASEQIVSSSLHGLIISDAYNIPNSWVNFGSIKDDFKYRDYYSTTHQREVFALPAITFQECSVKEYEKPLSALLNSCPFQIENAS